MGTGRVPELKRRLAAVMFTDMAGYTALMRRDEAAALRSRARHREALQRWVPEHDGEVLQYFGDGSLSIFRSSLQAVEAAIDIQRELGGRPALRVGLHVGDIAYDEQGAYGDAINIAARLEALSAAGGILISEKVFDDIRRHPQMVAVPRGSVRLKNVDDVVRTYALAVEGVAVPTDPVGREEEGSSGREMTRLPAEVRSRLAQRTRQLAPARPVGTVPGRVPMVGREREMDLVRTLLDQAEAGRGGTAFFRGPRGIGKSRLGQEAAEYTKSRGWSVLAGRAYPAEGLMPFAPFSDALLPLLQGLEPAVLGALAPGGEDALASLFPSLGPPGRRLSEADGQPLEPQARLFWHFAALVGRLAEHRPLLLLIEDLDFADRSSLELFHFLARHCTDKRIFIIGQYTGLEPRRKRELLRIEQSLVAAGAATVVDLGPLDEAETEELIRRAFDLEEGLGGRLGSIVQRWTGGNPFFVTGALRGLVQSRVLRREDGVWKGLDVADLELPHELRDSAVAWMSGLSEGALALARLVAVLGRQVTHELLLEIADQDRETLSVVLDELLRHQILSEAEERFSLVYDFRHPLLREPLRGELSLSERRGLHHRIATRLEAFYRASAARHADELAYHFGQAGPEGGEQAIEYLGIAGFAALDRYANQEALEYLQEALDRSEARPPDKVAPSGEGAAHISRLLAGLARAKRRLGDVQGSVALGRRVLALAQADGSAGAIARARREVGLSFMAGGLFEEAIEELEQALASAAEGGSEELLVRLLLAQGHCLHSVGRARDAEDAVRRALSLSEQAGRPELQGRVHAALMRMHIWTGRLDEVRTHAETARTLAHESGDANVEFWSEWAMGAMEGLIGNTEEMARRIERADSLAARLGSPLLRLETVELRLELLYARGDWPEGLDIGESAIDLARSLDARSIQTRLLVWLSQIHLARGELEIADRLTSEAWEVSGAEAAQGATGFLDVHTVVPAHIGRAAYHLAKGDWGDAARVAEAGLAIADRTGYVVWAFHHVLPIIAEASIHARDLRRAREIGARMRREAEALGHPLGLAWAEACDAVVSWLEGNAQQGAIALRRGAEALEGVPLIYDASRLRRQLAGRLIEIGARDGALRELLGVHETFSRLQARPELEKTVDLLRRLGVDLPAAPSAARSRSER